MGADVLDAQAEARAPVATVPTNKVYPFHEEPTDAIVVGCADPRFLDAIDKFLEDIGVYNPAMILVPGSVKAISLNVAFVKDWNVLRKQLDLMAHRNAHVPRVILFNHEDCKSYEKSAALFGGLLRVPGVQRDHLAKLAAFIRKEYLPSARFELYRARIVDDGGTKGVTFEEIAAAN